VGGRVLGAEFTKRVILTRDKTLVRGDVLVDDKPEIRGVVAPNWRDVLFDETYICHFPGRHLVKLAKFFYKGHSRMSPQLGNQTPARQAALPVRQLRRLMEPGLLLSVTAGLRICFILRTAPPYY
jgi:hypothetical protein